MGKGAQELCSAQMVVGSLYFIAVTHQLKPGTVEGKRLKQTLSLYKPAGDTGAGAVAAGSNCQGDEEVVHVTKTTTTKNRTKDKKYMAPTNTPAS